MTTDSASIHCGSRRRRARNRRIKVNTRYAASVIGTGSAASAETVFGDTAHKVPKMRTTASWTSRSPG